MNKVTSIQKKRIERMYKEYYGTGKVDLKRDTVYTYKRLKLVKNTC